MKGLAAGRFDLAAGGVSWTPERARITTALPRYAPFGKVALIRRAAAERFQTPEDLNQPGVRVIKNPGGTNERWVDEHLTRRRYRPSPTTPPFRRASPTTWATS